MCLLLHYFILFHSYGRQNQQGIHRGLVKPSTCFAIQILAWKQDFSSKVLVQIFQSLFKILLLQTLSQYIIMFSLHSQSWNPSLNYLMISQKNLRCLVHSFYSWFVFISYFCKWLRGKMIYIYTHIHIHTHIYVPILYFLHSHYSRARITGVTAPARNRKLPFSYCRWNQLLFPLHTFYSIPFINTLRCKLQITFLSVAPFSSLSFIWKILRAYSHNCSHVQDIY